MLAPIETLDVRRLKVAHMPSVRTLSLVIFAICCAGCSQQPVRIDFCDLARSGGPMNGAYVRVQAVGLFSRHGAYLAHPGCPTFRADWDEATSFRSDPSWITLGDAISQNDQANLAARSFAVNDLAVDVSARVVWQADRATLVVDKVHSTNPAPRVYRDQIDRDRAYCEFGTPTGIEPQETRAACERVNVAPPAND